MYVVITHGRNNKILFLVNRKFIKNRWWSYNVDDAFVFRKKEAAETQKNKLTYKKPEVIPLEEAERISNDQMMDVFDDDHPFSSEGLGQWC